MSNRSFRQVLPEIKFKDLKIRYMINRCHVVSEDKDFQLNTRVFKDSDYFRRRITLRIYVGIMDFLKQSSTI